MNPPITLLKSGMIKMVCPYSPEKHKDGVVCEHYKEESHTCNDAIDQTYCGAYNRLVGGTRE